MARGDDTARRIRELQVLVRRLEAGLERLARQARSSAAGRPRRKLRLTSRRRAELKLHGSYLGYIRLLGPRDKAQVQAVRAARGYHAAIALAKKKRR
jgi:hypothetical protein